MYTSKNDATRGKRHNNAAVIRSTDLGFPPEVADSGLELLNSDAFNKGMTPKSAAIASLGNSREQVFTQIYSNGLHQASCARIVHHRPPRRPSRVHSRRHILHRLRPSPRDPALTGRRNEATDPHRGRPTGAEKLDPAKPARIRPLPALKPLPRPCISPAPEATQAAHARTTPRRGEMPRHHLPWGACGLRRRPLQWRRSEGGGEGDLAAAALGFPVLFFHIRRLVHEMSWLLSTV